ncbi:hypothetical protein [Dethiosulfatarculus sandiegensis]|uniref:Uncharacterized protein n=1 Tax=Dethiosulfatarculus sandiegensis TaxID=1429043 RepID=A0A0D2GK90_9BACT|nr:hypothetical protein [Dethiosulfatarculus sandiegensis]KIX15187.1 hypothetical protein X474_04575 [Dethiosulfatarculus sandiegensis]
MDADRPSGPGYWFTAAQAVQELIKFHTWQRRPFNIDARIFFR